MHERPIGDLVDALIPMGAQIRYEAAAGFPPLLIGPGVAQKSPRTCVRGNVSSQFLTGLLLAAPLATEAGDLVIDIDGDLISRPYVEITLKLMQRFGVEVKRENWQRFAIPAHSIYRTPGDFAVEGDASSASYFLAAGVLGGGPVRVQGVGRASIQGDVRFAEVMRLLGGEISYGDDWIEVRRGPGKLRALDVDLNHIPDAAMTLAVAALFADGVTTIRNIASWRVKETDRIAAMATELRKVGAQVEEGADFIRIVPPPASALKSHAAIDTYDDHRMAMCFSLVALGGVPVRINDPQCVSKTFPDYFATLRQISH